MRRDQQIVIAIADQPGVTFNCRPNLRIRAALDNIRSKHHFREGVVELNGEALDADLTFADEIKAVIGEGMDNLHFNGETITSTSGLVLQFTFVNGEKEFHDFIYYLHLFL